MLVRKQILGFSKMLIEIPILKVNQEIANLKIDQDALIGIMGIQDKGDVTLIRHSYVRSNRRNQGIGTRLLRFLESKTEKTILIGTWAEATWAIAFYKNNGYDLLPEEEKNRLLRKYWTIPQRQVATSVVLAKKNIPKE